MDIKTPQQIVTDALTELMALEEKKLDLIAPFQSQIEALKSTIKPQIEALEDKMDEATYTIDMEIAHYSTLIEDFGPEVGATVKVQGPHGSISSVYYSETYTIDKKKFAGFAVSHPEAWQITEPVPAKVQIRRGK